MVIKWSFLGFPEASLSPKWSFLSFPGGLPGLKVVILGFPEVLLGSKWSFLGFPEASRARLPVKVTILRLPGPDSSIKWSFLGFLRLPGPGFLLKVTKSDDSGILWIKVTKVTKETPASPREAQGSREARFLPANRVNSGPKVSKSDKGEESDPF